MNLQELRREVERLSNLKENRENCTIDIQLRIIKQVVEAIDNQKGFNPIDSFWEQEDLDAWERIKDLLNLTKGGN